MPEKTAVVVVGMHRSGTSALARTISLLGAGLPADLVRANEGNPYGHWEPQGIVELNDRMLADAGSDVYGVVEIKPDWFASPRIAKFVTEATKVLRTSFGDDPLIVVKDPRVALLLPVWRQAFVELDYRCVYVLPLRHPDSVAESLQRRHLKTISYDAWTRPRGQVVWLRYTIAAVIGTRSAPRCFVNYSDLLNDWRAAMAKTADQLNVRWPRMGTAAEREIDAFLHGNELADVHTPPNTLDPQALDDLSLAGLADAFYASLLQNGDQEVLTDAVADGFRRRIQAASDLINTYEGLYPLVWHYYEASLAEKRKNESAGQRLSGMTDAIQKLWSDLTRAAAENSVVKQDLGSTSSRVVSLQAALDHLEKMLAESNEHRDTYFKRLGEALHHEKLAKIELDHLRQVVVERDGQLDAQVNANHALLTSTSWRLTAPMRAAVKLLKVR